MSMDTASVGARIADARERAGLTQAELATETGIARTALAKIERGIRGVGALEIASIARALSARIEWFLTDPPAALVSYRLREGDDMEVATINTRLERLARDVESVQELEPSLVPTALEAQTPLRSIAEAERLAEHARQLCGLDGREPINDLIDVVGGLGLFAFSQELGADTADAGTILLSRGAVSLVNSTGSVGRRRLSLAHELGHYLLADDYTIDWRIANRSSSDETEARIDRFARAFLAPEAGLRTFWMSTRGDHSIRDAAVQTASRFRIDMSTLARRLQDLGLADQSECSEVRSAKTLQGDIVGFGLVVPHDLEGTTVPSRFGQAVLKLYRQKRLSTERALSLLQGTLNAEDLPETNRSHEDEIWDLLT
ncbi:Zn-dependent peptidase ImmA (M78 family)/DNA-binding XRE family transcriptional regulator [Microbacterium natoriense]|uniref:Zn-dependent peptidase ImmA (M78 family)/DNA-binding XRE family transcriptional regulator n=1 Tax=Microbacterium natoriense TaxID=284570 RepID=A0AAW8EYJ5_9MICO|nr:XRE family transcriptional regulator [Microbacterium natoriense]MDQ0648540.1 Zn-dependent peptidase ImmA (M78 family)/DNA-binding XRE family transcriptional regulator [Microbacterium natoriense]